MSQNPQQCIGIQQQTYRSILAVIIGRQRGPWREKLFIYLLYFYSAFLYKDSRQLDKQRAISLKQAFSRKDMSLSHAHAYILSSCAYVLTLMHQITCTTNGAHLHPTLPVCPCQHLNLNVLLCLYIHRSLPFCSSLSNIDFFSVCNISLDWADLKSRRQTLPGDQNHI